MFAFKDRGAKYADDQPDPRHDDGTGSTERRSAQAGPDPAGCYRSDARYA
jgi:hypothetical protein